MLGVSLGDKVELSAGVEDVVVESEVTAVMIEEITGQLESEEEKNGKRDERSDEVGAGILLGLPSLGSDVLGGSLEVLSRDLVSPVGLNSLLDLT